jgi:hypothetical protein
MLHVAYLDMTSKVHENVRIRQLLVHILVRQQKLDSYKDLEGRELRYPRSARYTLNVGWNWAAARSGKPVPGRDLLKKSTRTRR